jgi:hypothetical protein
MLPFISNVKVVLVLPDGLEAVTVYDVGPKAAEGVPLMMPVASIPMDPGGGSELMIKPAGNWGEML